MGRIILMFRHHHDLQCFHTRASYWELIFAKGALRRRSFRMFELLKYNNVS